MIQTEREYAEALFTLAVEENAVEEFLDSLVTLKQLFDENPDYIEFLNSPAIPLGERTASIDEAFDGKTMALWMTPMRPPCTCPTCSQRKGQGERDHPHTKSPIPNPPPPTLYW